ncbi:MAG: hypothetical protein ACM3SY_13355 [Candidatus Omnitrophota bacterium]
MNRRLKEANIKRCLKDLDDYFSLTSDEGGIIARNLQTRVKARESLAHLRDILTSSPEIGGMVSGCREYSISIPAQG